MNISMLTEFFGWATVINVGFYLLVVVTALSLRGLLTGINARLFGLDETFVNREVFKFIGHYKLLMTVFCIVPYVALKIMA